MTRNEMENLEIGDCIGNDAVTYMIIGPLTGLNGRKEFDRFSAIIHFTRESVCAGSVFADCHQRYQRKGPTKEIMEAIDKIEWKGRWMDLFRKYHDVTFGIRFFDDVKDPGAHRERK